MRIYIAESVCKYVCIIFLKFIIFPHPNVHITSDHKIFVRKFNALFGAGCFNGSLLDVVGAFVRKKKFLTFKSANFSLHLQKGSWRNWNLQPSCLLTGHHLVFFFAIFGLNFGINFWRLQCFIILDDGLTLEQKKKMKLCC